MKKIFKNKYKFTNSTCKKGDCRNNKLSECKDKFNKTASKKNPNSDTILLQTKYPNGERWFGEVGISIKKGKTDKPTRFNFVDYDPYGYYIDD